MNLRYRFLAPALAAPCFLLAGCSAPVDDVDGIAPAQEALADAEGFDAAGDVDEAAAKAAPVEAGATAAGDMCQISGIPKPWGGRNWGSVRIELFSDASNQCWFTTVTSPSRLKLCASVDAPILGNQGNVCASNALSVTSRKVIGYGVSVARGSMGGFPIYYKPLGLTSVGAKRGRAARCRGRFVAARGRRRSVDKLAAATHFGKPVVRLD